MALTHMCCHIPKANYNSLQLGIIGKRKKNPNTKNIYTKKSDCKFNMYRSEYITYFLNTLLTDLTKKHLVRFIQKINHTNISNVIKLI